MEISKLRVALMCIEKDLCTREEFIDGRVIIDRNGWYYSEDDYIQLHNGEVVYSEYATYCEHYEEYYPSDDCRTVNIGRDTEIWSESAIRNSDLIYYDCEYYDECAADRHGIVYIEDEGEYGHQDDAYWNEDDGCYYSYSKTRYVRDYHSGSYKELNFNNFSDYKIGFEIEKEDEMVKESICINDFEENTDYKWRKERDGSLDNDSGFELISPTFEFDIDKIFEHIEDHDDLVRHINADYGKNCGGHIHLSHINLEGKEMFDLVCGYTPLLYSLYHGRVDKNYSKGKSNKDLIDENEKYQAIKIWGNRVEFRIISAVPNVQTLKWRARLIDLITKYPTNDVRKAYYYIDTKFKPLLSEVYSTDDKMSLLVNRIKANTLKFEHVDLNITKRQQVSQQKKAEIKRIKELEEFMKSQPQMVDGILTPSGGHDYEAWAELRNATLTSAC
jgi:hypothetical protein